MAITEFEFLDPERVDAVKSPANGTAWLMLKSAEEKAVYSEDGLVKYVNAEARRKYADSGVAMPSGDFPIPDEDHLRSAIGLLGNYKGDKAEAKAHIISRARALGLTHLLPEEWNVKKEAVPAESTRQTDVLHDPEGAGVAPEPGDGGTPPHCAAEDERPDPSGDQGDTAPDKSVPHAEADSQTDGAQKADRENPLGDHRAENEEGRESENDDADDAQKAKDPDLVTHGTGDTPGSHVWEAHDVALAEQAVEAAQRTLELARRFAAREKAEMSGNDTSTSKEIEDMTRDELIKFLDERDEARHAAEAAKGVDEAAAKAQDGQPAAEGPAADVSKSLESITAALGDLQKQVAAIAEQDTRPRPLSNAAGVPRGDASSSSAFKALDDAVANARNETERRDAHRRLTMAKLIAGQPGQVATVSGLGTPLVTNRRELPADQQVVGV